MANGTKGMGQAPLLETLPMGGQTCLSPQTPLGNFSGLMLRIALSATRGGAELETDWERFGCQWSVSMGDALGFDNQLLIRVMNRYK